MPDSLGDRMKEQYEDRTRFFLPRRTFTCIRVDGKSFHSYTKAFERPFDKRLSDTMDRTAVALCENLQGVKLGYVQSDEISVILSDFDSITTEAWFNGNLQKMVSVAASVATMAFNEHIRGTASSTATFDARAFTIPDREEVMNYLVWRQQDATRNSVQMLAQSLYSQKQLHGKNSSELQEMIFTAGKNWDAESPRFKRGSAIVKTGYGWAADENTPVFTKNRSYLYQYIPTYEHTTS